MESLVTADLAAQEKANRVIGPVAGASIVAGSMLGIGIFLSPPIVAANVPSLPGFFLLWLLGGVIALSGAVSCAELGTMMPRSGGDYVFQHRAFGPSLAFASGWVLFGPIFCGSIASMAVGMCTYQLPLLLGRDLSGVAFTMPLAGLPVSWAQVAALGLVPALTLLNAMGARPSARTQAALTLLPIGVLTLISGYAITHGGGGAAAASAAPTITGPITLHGVVVAYLAVYFAYSGWINIIYVAGEVEQPRRGLPRAMLGGTLVVTCLYLLLCSGFVRTLGFAGLAGAGEAGSASAQVLAGDLGKLLITILISSALVASINGTIMAGPRVAYAMGKRGAAWRWLGVLHPRTRVPVRALWVQAVVSGVLIVSGKFEQLLAMVSLTMVVTGSITVAALYVLRRTAPDAPRPYKATGYPAFPLVYLVSSVIVIVDMARSAGSGAWADVYPLIGLVGTAALFVAHRVYLRVAAKTAPLN